MQKFWRISMQRSRNGEATLLQRGNGTDVDVANAVAKHEVADRAKRGVESLK